LRNYSYQPAFTVWSKSQPEKTKSEPRKIRLFSVTYSRKIFSGSSFAGFAGFAG